MKILVIGGTVFIGAAAVRRLAEDGHEVAVLNRGKSGGPLPDGVTRIAGDRARLAESRDAIAAFAPDAVLHNIVVTAAHARQAVDVLSGIAGRLVMTSSCDVYQAYGRLTGTEPGPPLPVPITEQSPLRTVLYPYRARVNDPSHLLHDYDKIPAEEAVLSASLPGTVMRLPMVLGPGDYQHRLHSFIKPMRDGRRALLFDEGSARWRSTYGFVDNVAHALALACTDPRAAGSVFNVGDWPLSTIDLAAAVAKELGWNGEIVTAPAAELPEELRPSGMDTAQDLVCSDALLRGTLGFRARVALPDAIHATVAWESEHPPSPEPDPGYAAIDAFLASRQASP